MHCDVSLHFLLRGLPHGQRSNGHNSTYKLMFPAGFGSFVSVSRKSYISIGKIIGYTRSPSEGTSVHNPNAKIGNSFNLMTLANLVGGGRCFIRLDYN